MATARISHSAETTETSTDRPSPWFGAAGCRGEFFSVREDMSGEDAINCASMFLRTAIEISTSNLTEGSRNEQLEWASLHLVEMAKALVDTAVNSRFAEGANHG